MWLLPSPVNPKPCVTATGSPFCQSLVVLPSYSVKGASSSSPGMADAPGFKSQCQSSSAAPFLTPPTITYTSQHSCILPALLGCHSKSGQVWPHGMEPIFSKLSCRHCHQGELLPSSILGGSHSHPSPWLKAWPQLFNIPMKPVKGYRYVK